MRKPFFRKRRGQPNGGRWHVRHNGKLVNLGSDKTEAFKEYYRLMSETAEVAPLTGKTDVAEVVGLFLDWAERNRSDSTYQWYKHFLLSFGDFAGGIKLSALRPFHVTRWREKHKYEGNTANAAVRCVLRCFNWGVAEGHLKENPVKGVEKPSATARECYIEAEDWTKLMAKATGSLRDFLMILRETGCRPQEARAVESRHFDRKLRAWVFPKNESKGKKRQRVVPLNDSALAITKRLVLKYPEGPLFRNSKGQPWTKDAVQRNFKRLARKVGTATCLYAVRHSFVTDALVRGVEPMTLATIVGHANIDMIWEVYNKIRHQQDHIRNAIKLATGEAASA